MKGKLIFSFIVATILLSITALAVATYAEWQNGSSTITINKNDGATFSARIFSTTPPVTYSIYMYNPSNAIVKRWITGAVNNDGKIVLTGLRVDRLDLTTGGTYRIEIESTDNDGFTSSSELTLNVLNNGPSITGINAPDSINAGELLSVSFTASDGDGDALSYKIYRNDVLISSTNSNAWQTSSGDAGTYVYRFEATDGESTIKQTKTIIVKSASAQNKAAVAENAPETLKLNRDIEISQVYTNFLKIRSNKGERLNDFEIKVMYLDTNAAEDYNFDLERNEVVYKMLTADLQENKTYLARIDVSAEGMEDSGYMIIKG
jgi:hypothetical protein